MNKKTKEEILEDIIKKLTLEEFELLCDILNNKVYVEERDIIQRVIKNK